MRLDYTTVEHIHIFELGKSLIRRCGVLQTRARVLRDFVMKQVMNLWKGVGQVVGNSNLDSERLKLNKINSCLILFSGHDDICYLYLSTYLVALVWQIHTQFYPIPVIISYDSEGYLFNQSPSYYGFIKVYKGLTGS